MANKEGISYGLLIPIAVLVIVMLLIGERWLLVPIAILFAIFLCDAFKSSKIKLQEEQIDYWRAPEIATDASVSIPKQSIQQAKPIYDQKKQKEQGVTCGTLIPIIIVGWLFWESRSWVFLIPLLFLFTALIENLSKGVKGKSRIREEIQNERVITVSDLSNRTGLSEERVREHIVTEKRSGSTDIWFDHQSGQITHTPSRTVNEPVTTSVGCLYCGFALKPDDRFCPFCGAPIKVS